MRYMRKGITKFFFVPTIASAALVPTAAEVNAGTNITPDINEVNGFAFSNDTIETRDMDTTFVGNIPGEESAEDSSLVFYEHRGGLPANPIKTALAKGTSGYVVIFFDGIAGATPAAGDDADVWPAQVASNVRQYTAANEAGMWRADFAMTSEPAFDVTLT